jgi:predicted O-methyltransferase YrrM
MVATAHPGDQKDVSDVLSAIGLVPTPQPPRGTYPKVTARDGEVFRAGIAAVQPDLVIEFGSWEGRSALAWLRHAGESGTPCRVLCVDTWLGNPDLWLGWMDDPEWSKERLRLEKGEPHVFRTFCSTMHRHGVQDRVVPFRCTTTTAARILEFSGVQADIVYVDAGHDLRSVISDVLDALVLVKPTGLVMGDDWGWPEVRAAVTMVCAVRRIPLAVSPDGASYALGRGPARPALQHLVDARGWQRQSATTRIGLVTRSLGRFLTRR